MAYGRQVSAKVGNPFVVDTSRNGRGTYLSLVTLTFGPKV